MLDHFSLATSKLISMLKIFLTIFLASVIAGVIYLCSLIFVSSLVHD